MADLERSGVKLVVEGASQATSQLTAFNKALGNLNGASQNVARGQAFNRLNKEMASTFQNIGRNVPGFSKLTNVLGATSAQSTQLAAALGGVTIALGAITVATGAAVAGFAGFVALGKRGLQIENTAKAFANSVAAFGDADTVLKNLRTQTRGTVSDVELMRLSIAALQGTSQDFRKIVAPNLGKVFDVTARAARATGQSVDIVREKFILGLRRQSVKLLDDIGVMVKAETAYAKYAETIGKSASALTDLEKQAAFAAEGISQLEAIGKEAGGIGFADIIERSTAVFSNMIDKLSLALLPAFKPILGQFNVFLDVVENIASYAIPVLQTLAQVVGTTITAAFNTAKAIFDAFFGGIGQGAGQTLPYAIALFQIFGDIAQTVIKGVATVTQNAIKNFASLVNFFLKPLGKVGEFISRLFKGTNDQFNNGFEQLAFNVAKGGASIIGAFAAGLLRGGTKVAEAAGKIAQIVADFLVGFSPPKKGALSQIDKGAANIAKAFAEGFVGGILPPVEQVAADIDRQLGVIGTFGLDQIKAAFGRLDLAIRPFTEQLQLAKADLQAIAGFIDPALKIAERQRKNLLKAFGRGEAVDVNSLRFQDAQISNLKELKDMEEGRVDQAELQLGLVTAAQASERALLAIQQARLGTTEAITAETESAVKEAKAATAGADKAPSGGGGAASETGQGESGGFTPGEAPDLLSNEAVDNAKKQILGFAAGVGSAAQRGISEGLAQSGFNDALSQFQGATGNVKSQLSRAASANPAKSILDKFKGLTAGVSSILNPFKEEFERVFNALFGDEGSISGFITRWGDLLAPIFTAENSPVQLAKNAITDLGTELGTMLGSIDFLPFKTQINTTFGMESEDSPFLKIGTAIKGAKELFTEFQEGASSVFDSLFGKEGVVIKVLEDFNTLFIGVFDNLFKEGGQIDQWMGNFLLFVGTTIGAIVEKFNLLTGEGQGSIRGALATLGEVLYTSAIVPFLSVANMIVQSAEDAINIIVAGFNSLPLPDLDWSANFGEITLPGYARGGLGVKGSFIAGEKGAELITPSRPVNVFPAAATRALMSMAAQPMPMYAGYGGGNTTNNNSNMSQSNTFNVNSPQQAMLLEKQMRAGMRR